MIDTHGHLCDAKFEGMRDRLVDEMSYFGVTAFVDSAYDPESGRRAVADAARYSQVYATVGTHPEHARDFRSSDLDMYRAMCSDPKVVAVGETGLDYHYDGYDADIQYNVCCQHIELAYDAGLPVVLHVRDAYADALRLMKDMRAYLVNGVQLHCYSGSLEMLDQFNRFDCYYSFGGVVTFANWSKAEVCRAVPTDRLLLETDCPYLSPVPVRGRINFPSNIRYILAKMAEILGKSVAELDRITTRNALTLYDRIKI